MEKLVEPKKKKCQASHNKKTGAKFESDIRSIFKNHGWFIYVKGSSTAGIDIFAIRRNKTIFIELKSHSEYKRFQYKDAMTQLKSNENIVKDFMDKTFFFKEHVKYVLIYFIRNTKLIINDVDGNIKEYEKSKDVVIEQFLIDSLMDYGLLNF